MVLSYFLVRQELGASKRIGCYFLDDYAEWLGEEGEQIADLLILSPEVLPDGTRHLSIVVTEAKYVAETSLAEKTKGVSEAASGTACAVSSRPFSKIHQDSTGICGCRRFSDLLLTGIPYSAGDPIDLVGFRRLVREGRCRIFLRGYSHVFVSRSRSRLRQLRLC